MAKTSDHRGHRPAARSRTRGRCGSAGSPTLAFQDGYLLTKSEHLQRSVEATAKENPEGGENYGNQIEHNSTV
jgi:hypothetical protein